MRFNESILAGPGVLSATEQRVNFMAIVQNGQSPEWWVPIPPSVNNLYRSSRNGKRYKTTKYRRWIKEASFLSVGFRSCVSYPVGLLFTVREKVNQQRDLDNMLKPMIDLLKESRVILEDNVRHVQAVAIRYRPGTGHGVLITIETL